MDLAPLIPRLVAPDWEDTDTQIQLRRFLETLAGFQKWVTIGRMIDTGVVALGEVSGSLPGPLVDPDPATRTLASRTVTALGNLRRIVRYTGRTKIPADPSGDRIRGLVAGLTDDLKHKDPEVRLAAATALETLSDCPRPRRPWSRPRPIRRPDRWTVAQALRPQPVDPRPALPVEIETLARLATDKDIDVRIAALGSLEKMVRPVRSHPAVLRRPRTGR